MGRKRLYVDKEPRQRGSIPREHFTRKNGSWKPKHPFDNEASAANYIAMHDYFMRNGYVPYVCGFCGCWHIGRRDQGSSPNT